ncbi:hypothetical protein A3A14_01045 [Candidatus Daviesbacteria bacterium RIFCSPLOWO2_01_FULL_43_38]|uniref:Glycosyl transferase family 1 domain-containing protein n=2 Tax=Candidatus Daviesiibacteriota TaxID=1752718 RepID=A0A1F5K6C9_9BACT|nr:MAG: hypothetical protein A3E45_01125 [Candidatus Daviesbacteria bacterium RIFCSPHIGHO2_12_FULL_43_11]OGE63551.1 MAG: hypothetical protein A3A14_01045 [Candidatus Daviesbacteria bacterium RIFCSPLOWO2_01_FULL_43_38]
MRIGIITHNYPNKKGDRQNAGIFVYDIAHALKKLGHEIFVLCPGQGEADEIPVTWFGGVGSGQKMGNLKPYNPFDLIMFLRMVFSGLRATDKFVSENKVDFIVGMWAFPAGIFALWAKLRHKVPYCLWALGSDVYVYARYPVLGWVIKRALFGANFLLADGIDLAKKASEIAERKCEFLPSASQLSHKSKPAREKKGPLRFVFLGRMEPVKGADVLIDAVSKIADLDFEVHCMGDGSLLPGLKERVSDLSLGKKVFFYGNVSDPEVIYTNLSFSDWLVIPSRSDSIPLVFSEGTKAGLPMIVAEVGDMVELVKDYKVGLSFPKENSKKLAEILRDVIVKGRVETEKYRDSVSKVAQLFDVNSSAEKLAKMIKREK